MSRNTYVFVPYIPISGSASVRHILSGTDHIHCSPNNYLLILALPCLLKQSTRNKTEKICHSKHETIP